MPDHLDDHVSCYSAPVGAWSRHDLLVHHKWAHTEDDTLKVASLGGIAEHLAPTWLTHFFLEMNNFHDLVELALD